jgi:hypothetical protein
MKENLKILNSVVTHSHRQYRRKVTPIHAASTFISVKLKILKHNTNCFTKCLEVAEKKIHAVYINSCHL